MSITHTSHSAIEEYLKCPMRFKLNRIDKVPREQVLAGPAGTAFHRMTEMYDNGEGGGNYEDHLQEAMEDDVQYLTIRGEDYSWWVTNGERMFARYVEWRNVTKWEIEGVEEEFRVQPDGLELPVVGFIDRRFRTSTGVAVILDIKTGFRIPNDSKQLPLYVAARRIQSAAEGSGGGTPAVDGEEGSRIATSYYHSRSGDSTGLDWPDYADEQWLVDYIHPVEQNVLRGQFDPKPSAANCRYCPVRNHCGFKYVPVRMRAKGSPTLLEKE